MLPFLLVMKKRFPSLFAAGLLVLGTGILIADEKPDPRSGDTLTKEVQASLSPDEIVAELEQGNERFRSGELIDFDFAAQMKATATGQNPAGIILACVDSRVVPEIVFDTSIGDMFDARVAGNVVNEDIAGSMEYACAKAGSKLVLVMGHTNCGAVKGAIDGVELGNLTGLLAKIKPAIDAVKDVPGERNSKNKAFVTAVVRKNVELTIAETRRFSPVLKKLEDEGKIAIRGCVYDVATGKVEMLKGR